MVMSKYNDLTSNAQIAKMLTRTIGIAHFKLVSLTSAMISVASITILSKASAKQLSKAGKHGAIAGSALRKKISIKNTTTKPLTLGKSRNEKTPYRVRKSLL